MYDLNIIKEEIKILPEYKDQICLQGANGEKDPFVLLQTLDAYASDVHYFAKVEKIIELIREKYKLNYRK